MHRALRTLLLPALASTALLGGVASTAQAADAPASSTAGSARVVSAAAATSKSIAVAEDEQDTPYYCGPAAVRNALSGRHIHSVQSSLAGEMHTDTNGTDSVADVTPVLNKHAKTSWYESKYISGQTATSGQVALLKRDVKLDVDHGYVIVANIVGTAVDTSGHSHTYSGGHYIDVVGYSSSGSTARIYDPANDTKYSMSTSRLATWIATRGYSA